MAWPDQTVRAVRSSVMAPIKLRKMRNKDLLRWFIQSVSGLLLTGAGLCLAIDAGFSRASGGDWFWYGTFSLVVFQAGVCLMIDSVRFRIRSGR